jgi:hypothetical protein
MSGPFHDASRKIQRMMPDCKTSPVGGAPVAGGCERSVAIPQHRSSLCLGDPGGRGIAASLEAPRNVGTFLTTAALRASQGPLLWGRSFWILRALGVAISQHRSSLCLGDPGGRGIAASPEAPRNVRSFWILRALGVAIPQLKWLVRDLDWPWRDETRYYLVEVK